MPAPQLLPSLGGQELRKFDQANRLTIPAKFITDFGSKVYLFKNFQSNDCIVLYNEEDYLSVYYGLEESYSGKELSAVQNYFIDHIFMAVIDKAGRISLRQDYIDFAGLKEEVLIVRQPNRLEIWDPDKWNKKVSEEAVENIDFSKFSISPKRK